MECHQLSIFVLKPNDWCNFMARVPTPTNFDFMSAKERRDWIESQIWTEGGLKSILEEEALANKEQEEEEGRRLYNRIKQLIFKK